jgi:hypothetical protein
VNMQLAEQACVGSEVGACVSSEQACVSRRAHLLDCLGLFLHRWGFPLTGVLGIALVQGKLPFRVLDQPGIVPGPIDLTAPAPGLSAAHL